MKRALSIVGLVFLALLVAVTGFYFWASGSTLSPDDRATVKTYHEDFASPRRDTFTVMSYNIGYLSGMTNNEPVVRERALFDANLEAALDLIRDVDPDFIGFQEIDFDADRSFNVHQLDTIATRLDYPNASQAVNWDVRYLPFPYGRPSVHFGRVLSGQAVLSRYPIRTHRRVVLEKTSRSALTQPFYLDRLAEVAIVDVGGWPLTIINVHLEAFEQQTREKQAEQVRDLYSEYAGQGTPVLLIGDFNSILPMAFSTLPPEERAAFAGDQTMTTILDLSSLVAAFPESRYVAGGVPNTYPADDPTRKIDHIFYRGGRIRPVDADVHCGPDAAPPSDHCAVSFSFTMPRPRNAQGLVEMPGTE